MKKPTTKNIALWLEEAGLAEKAQELREWEKGYKDTHPAKKTAEKAVKTPKKAKAALDDGFGTPETSIEIKDLCVIAGMLTNKMHATAKRMAEGVRQDPAHERMDATGDGFGKGMAIIVANARIEGVRLLLVDAKRHAEKMAGKA